MKGFVFNRIEAEDGVIEDIYCNEVHLRCLKSNSKSFLGSAVYYISMGKCYDTDGNCYEEVKLPRSVDSLVEDGSGAKSGCVIV